MQKLIMNASIEKLFNRTFEDLKEQAVYQSLKARGQQRSNFEGLLALYKDNRVIKQLTDTIEVELRETFIANRSITRLV